MTIKLSKGNKKLKPNKDTRFLIFSIPPQTTCPYATDHCRQFCYAMKSWKAYPNVRSAWTDNYNATLDSEFILDMVNAIDKNLALPSFKATKSVVFRIHESGDFYNKEYAKKWLEIAWYMYHFGNHNNRNKVTFIAYTKSVEFFKGEKIPPNMVIRFSLWDDTDPTQYEIAKDMGLPIYTAVEKFTDEPKIERCGCVDCAKCTKCWNELVRMIKCEIH